MLTRGENRESLAVEDKRGIEKRRKISWEMGGGSFIFAVIKRREKEHRASSKGELKEKVRNFPPKYPQAHVQERDESVFDLQKGFPVKNTPEQPAL